MSKKKKITSSIPREKLEPGWKMHSFKINPNELGIMERVTTDRRITKAQFIREAIQGMEVVK